MQLLFYTILIYYYRSRLNSTGTEEDEDEIEYGSASSSASSSSSSAFESSFEDHLHYMRAREYLPEFPGQVPNKKKQTQLLAEVAEPQSQPKAKVSTYYVTIPQFR